MTREEHVKIQTALFDAYLEVANMDLSDVKHIDDRQSVTADKFRAIASEKILSVDGLSYEDISEEYKKSRQNGYE